MSNIERCKHVLNLLKGSSALEGAHGFRATDFGLRYLLTRKVVDIQFKNDNTFDVTIFKTGCKVVLGREDATEQNIANIIECILADHAAKPQYYGNLS